MDKLAETSGEGAAWPKAPPGLSGWVAKAGTTRKPLSLGPAGHPRGGGQCLGSGEASKELEAADAPKGAAGAELCLKRPTHELIAAGHRFVD